MSKDRQLRPSAARHLPAAALAFVLMAVPALAQDKPVCSQGGNIPNLAVNCPDMFAWQLFAQVNAPVSGGQVAFQTYSSDGDTFQCPPADLATCKANPKAAGCPVWPTAPRPAFTAALTQRTQRSVRFGPGVPSAHRLTNVPPQQDCWNYYNNNLEIVYRNRPTFDYIVANGLWYVEGVETQFERGFVYDFPLDSVEVKTNWFPLAQAPNPQGSYFTWDDQGTVYALISMHITSKSLPNWFWATFEHVDNWGRCDFLGCHDSFGSLPPNVPSHDKELCQTYPPGELTPALRQLLARLPKVFQNYRLKGSMTDFTSPTGSPNLLGNSVTEAGFVPTASCMTCHSRAAVQATAGPPQGLSPYPNIAGFTPEGQSYNGTPDPNWYYSGNHPLRRWSVQTDFVWAVPFKANTVQATKCCCELGGGTCQFVTPPSPQCNP